MGYEAYLSEIVSRAIELRASERGKARAGAGGKSIFPVFGAVVRSPGVVGNGAAIYGFKTDGLSVSDNFAPIVG